MDQMENAMTHEQPERRRNIRTALILASIALVFFAGIMVRHWLFGN